MKDDVSQVLSLLTNYTYIQTDMNAVIVIVGEANRTTGDIKKACAELGIDCSPFNDIETIIDSVSGNLKELPDIDSSLEATLQDVLNTFEDIPEQINDLNITGMLEDVKNQVNDITETFDDVLEPINEIQERVVRNMTHQVDDFFTDSQFDMIMEAVKNGFLGIGGFLALVLTVVVVAVLAGVCSRDGKSSCASSSLCIFMSLFSLFAIFLFLLCTLLFTVGSLSQKIVCDTLDDPRESQLVAVMDNILNDLLNEAFNDTSLEESHEFNISFADIIDGLHRGDAIYPLLQLDNIYNISDLAEWQTEFNVTAAIDEARKAIGDAIKDIENIQDNIEEDEIKGIVAGVDASVNSVLPMLMNKTQVNEQLDLILGSIDELLNTSPEQIKNEILKLKIIIGRLNTEVSTVQEDFADVLKNFGDTDRNELELSEFVNGLFDKVDVAFNIIPGEVNQFFNDTVDGLLDAVDEQVSVVINAVNNEIGRTEPLSNIYDATYTAVCLDLVAPLNSSKH